MGKGRCMNRLKTLLGCPLPGKLKKEMDADRMKRSYRQVMILAGVVALFELALVALALIEPGAVWGVHSQPQHLLFFLALLAVTLAAIAAGWFGRRALERRPAVFLALCYLYAIFICAWGSALSAYEHTHYPSIVTFLYVVLCVSFLIPMRPWQAMALLAGNQVLFVVLLLLLDAPVPERYISILNSGIASLLGIVASGLLYHGRVRDFVNRLTILRQNQEIIDINRQLSQLVYTDELTRAANRRYLEEVMGDKLQRARAAQKSVAVMMLDLRFENILSWLTQGYIP